MLRPDAWAAVKVTLVALDTGVAGAASCWYIGACLINGFWKLSVTKITWSMKMKRLTDYFLKGLLVFVPAALTVFFIVWAFKNLDSLFREILKIPIPGLGLVLTLVLITVIGFLVSNFVGKWIFALIDKAFSKLPLVKLLYSSLKDLIAAFAGEKKKFDKPVLVSLTRGGPQAMGFVTRDSLEFLEISNHVAVYLPQSYNFAGSLVVLPSNQVKALDINSSDAMTFIVSGGVTGFD